MGMKSSMSLVSTTPSTPSVERVRRKYCLPDCSSSMAAILTGAETCFGRLKTGFWYSGMAESVFSAASAAGTARGEAASKVAALTKLRRFIGISIARGANHRALVRVILRLGDWCMKFGAMVLAVCGVMHGFQAAPAKGSIEGQVMNLKAGSPLKKALSLIHISEPTRLGM